MDGEEAVLDLIGTDSGGDDGSQVQDVDPNDAALPVDGDDSATGIQDDQHSDTDKPAVSPFTKYKADLAELKASKPEIVKDIQRAFGKIASIDKLGTTEQITQTLEAVGLHGGIEGLQTLPTQQQRAQELGRTIRSRRRIAHRRLGGKDSPMDSRSSYFPRLTTRTVEPAAIRIGYDRATGRFLEKYGTFGQIEKLGQAIDPANKAAVDMFNELVKNIFSPLRGAASRQNRPDPLASERRSTCRRRKQTELANNEQNEFKESVNQRRERRCVRSELQKQVGIHPKR